MTLERAFESTVILFELTNFLATFQMMINEIFQDLINTEKVVSFIDNVIMGIEIEKSYDKIVKEIVRRLAENDLYIKPEKYKWNV